MVEKKEEKEENVLEVKLEILSYEAVFVCYSFSLCSVLSCV